MLTPVLALPWQKAFGRDGANVLVNYSSNPERAEELAHSISLDNTCGDAIAIKCDVGKEDQVIAMYKQPISHFGTVDICAANAGLQKDASLHEMTLAQWQLLIDVNLTGQFLCTREAIKEFMRSGPRPEVSKALGKIIHMSSVHEIFPWLAMQTVPHQKGASLCLCK